jgi:DNA helicase-2/ATP-dependent DNA helicase PcrA
VKEIIKDLNKVQQKAVTHTDGATMVIAGAGSGKTRVLTYKVAYLIEKGIDPFNILALTFTNKAAREMKERITQLVGHEARNVWMGTFHSVFARILRFEGHRLGYPSNFTIYDADDTKRLIKTIIKENNLDDKQYAPNYVLNRISGAKTNLISPQEYNNNFEILNADKSANKPLIGKIYTIYNARLRKAYAMDFDDLLYYTNILFRDFEDALYKYQQKFSHILVDEYQDTNHSQYLIIKRLAANNENICVVGDDAQSIYAFRGANIQNILNFQTDYPDHTIYKLEQNYRSTQMIVNAANGIILNNKDQIKKEIWTDNEEGNQIKLLRATTDNEEGILVANAIFENKMNQQLGNEAFAILYRTNAQSRSIEEALRRQNIPYRIFGGLSFYKRKEIKDILAYFRIVNNNNDEDALLRTINYPARGIGATTIQRLQVAADEHKTNLWSLISDPAKFPTKINAGTRNKIENFVTMIKSFTAQLDQTNAYELGKAIASSSGILKELYNDKTPEGVTRYENIEELLNAIKEFTETELTEEQIEEREGNITLGLSEFMQDVALITDADTKDKDGNDYVSLMTIHAAKGLEFPFVFIVGLEENLFPSIQSLNSRTDLEEERRLFYVALTRAEKQLFISYAENRYKWGNLTVCEPSRFIEEVDDKFIDRPQRVSIFKSKLSSDDVIRSKSPIQQKQNTSFAKKNLKKINKTVSSSPDSVDPELFEKLQNGMEVEHSKFGKGKVVNLEGDGPNKKATVFFPTVGQKQLLLKFAKLKIV